MEILVLQLSGEMVHLLRQKAATAEQMVLEVLPMELVEQVEQVHWVKTVAMVFTLLTIHKAAAAAELDHYQDRVETHLMVLAEQA